MAQGEAQWFQEAESLSERLRKVYTSAPFCHMSLLEISSCLATDQWLDCDLSFALKHITNPVQEPVVLPEVFANLNSVMGPRGLCRNKLGYAGLEARVLFPPPKIYLSVTALSLER